MGSAGDEFAGAAELPFQVLLSGLAACHEQEVLELKEEVAMLWGKLQAGVSAYGSAPPLSAPRGPSRGISSPVDAVLREDSLSLREQVSDGNELHARIGGEAESTTLQVDAQVWSERPSAGSSSIGQLSRLRRESLVNEFLENHYNLASFGEVEKALSGKAFHDPMLPWRLNWLANFMQSNVYEGLWGVLVWASILVMAFQMQYEGMQNGYTLGIRSMERPASAEWPHAREILEGANSSISVVFIVEAAIRILLLRRRFFMEWLNCLDAAIAAVAVAELIQDTVNITINPVMMRLARFTKLSRAFRMLKLSKVFDSVQLMLGCIASSVHMLGWSLIILLALQCAAAVVFCSVTESHIRDEQQSYDSRLELFYYYGTYTNAFFTTFEVMFANWAPAFRALADNTSDWHGVIFIVYRCTISYAILNVVGAIFVSQTIKQAHDDEEVQYLNRMKQLETWTQKLGHAFNLLDSSGNGLISWNEFQRLMQNPKLQFWLNQLELDTHDLKGLFDMFDADGSGEVSMDEFMQGAAKFKGTARSIDIFHMMACCNRIEARLAGKLSGKTRSARGSPSSKAASSKTGTPSRNTSSSL